MPKQSLGMFKKQKISPFKKIATAAHKPKKIGMKSRFGATFKKPAKIK